MAKTYSLTPKANQNAPTKGQQMLIHNDLAANPNSTIEQIAARIKANLTTRQDPARVVAFYMSTWKKKGLVIVAGESAIAEHDVVGESQTVRPDPEDVAEETPVLPGTFDGNAPSGDTAPTSEKPTLGERIVTFAAGRPDGFWADDVVAELNGEVSKKQVNDSLRRLVAKSLLIRADSGEYLHTNFDPTKSAVATE